MLCILKKQLLAFSLTDSREIRMAFLGRGEMFWDALVFIKTHIFLLVTQPAHKTIYLYYSL